MAVNLDGWERAAAFFDGRIYFRAGGKKILPPVLYVITGVLVSSAETREKRGIEAMSFRKYIITGAFVALLLPPFFAGDDFSGLVFAGEKQAPGKESDSLLVDRLIKTMRYGDKRDREDSVIALGMIGEKRAVRPLCEYLQHTSDRNMRMVIIRSLGRISSSEATPVLIKVLETDDYEFSRIEAASALGEIADNDSIVALEAALKDRSVRVRRRCAQILEEITGEKYEYEGKLPAPSFDEYYQRLEELKAKTKLVPTPSG